MVSEAYALALHRVRAAQDGSGNIDAKELKALMESVGKVVTEEEVAEMVLMADSDGSGEIDFAEFLGLMARQKEDSESDKLLHYAFNLFVKDDAAAASSDDIRFVMRTLWYTLTVQTLIRFKPYALCLVSGSTPKSCT